MGWNQAVDYSLPVSHLVVGPVLTVEVSQGLCSVTPVLLHCSKDAGNLDMPRETAKCFLKQKGVYICTGKNIVCIGFGTVHYSGVHWGLGKNSL